MAILIDLITPDYPSFNVTMGAIFQQLACSYNLLFTDTTTINLPQFDYGQIYYKVNNNTVASGLKGGTAIANFCEAGTFDVTQGIIIRDPNSACPYTGTILYQEEQTFTVNILEWMPLLNLPQINCCFQLNVPITINPSNIELNNNVCQTVPIPNSGFYNEGGTSGFIIGGFSMWNSNQEVLIYKLYYYDIANNLWIEDAAQQVIYSVTTNNPLAYPFTFTPNKLTKYKIEATIYNCCTSVTKEIEITICDNVTIKHSCEHVTDCNTCNVYFIDNYTTNNYTIKVKDLLIDAEIDEFESPAGERVEYEFTEDSVYMFEYTDSTNKKVYKVVPVICQIDKCYMDLLRALLCSDAAIDKCCTDKKLNDRLANIQPLYQTYIKLIEPYIDINARYNIINITNKLDEFMKIKRIRDLILEFCDICRRFCGDCFNTKNKCI